MRIEFALNSHSWQCEFNAHCVHSDEQLERSDSMRIKGVAVLCHVIITRWQTAWKWRPFSAFVSAWVHPPDMHLASTSLSFVTLQWRLVVLGVIQEGTVSHDFRPCPRISIAIRFESTSNPPPDVDWTNAHSMRIELMRIQWTCMWTRTKRIQCALEVPCEWAFSSFLSWQWQNKTFHAMPNVLWKTVCWSVFG